MSYGLPSVPIKSEASRRYVQWKDEDVRLLLTDLEQAGHYEKWKANKSGYSKRVAEEVFRNIMYHEAIKFKVRWLESRFRRWEAQLTLPEIQQDGQMKAEIQEKMHKEFPFYDQCKRIFDTSSIPIPSSTTPVVSDAVLPTTPLTTTANNSTTTTITTTTAVAGAPTPASIENSSTSPPTAVSDQPLPNADTIITPRPTAEPERAHSVSPLTSNIAPPPPPSSSSSNVPPTTTSILASTDPNTFVSYKKRKATHRITDGIAEERRLKVLDMELQVKRMEHEERMQQMKLEQLRLEIELEKLRRSSAPSAE
ncbi:hypothetical protein DFQ28_005820 [Apophysomyces sp. BC1034]|nr:hypothetical protein DFQ30_009146 [Apophysomyces sp. BC1015]KAG0174527.1 hypothetical protein DFQ29_007451 [Apophysomyces sp. BC1021]KAG0187811.1 hypothetical protein DFQ28_005820 [Apophysomyces sp. BC1034]